MKVIINTCFGGASLSEDYAEVMCKDRWDFSRTDERIIRDIENGHGKTVQGRHSELVVATLPEEATDYYIQEYDGMETLLYVLGGKIRTWDED